MMKEIRANPPMKTHDAVIGVQMMPEITARMAVRPRMPPATSSLIVSGTPMWDLKPVTAGSRAPGGGRLTRCIPIIRG